MVSVAFVEIAHDANVEMLLTDVLVCSEQDKARSFLHVEDRNSYVVAHGLKRLILASELNVHPNDLQFSQNEFGKPKLLNDDFFFNLSHTAGMVAFAWAISGPVGVDIECIGRLSFDDDAAKLVLSGEEYFSVCSAKNPQASFVKFWTMKEAVAKAEGKGLNMDFRQIVSINNRVTIESRVWKLHRYHLFSDHIATLATLDASVGKNMILKTEDLTQCCFI